MVEKEINIDRREISGSVTLGSLYSKDISREQLGNLETGRAYNRSSSPFPRPKRLASQNHPPSSPFSYGGKERLAGLFSDLIQRFNSYEYAISIVDLSRLRCVFIESNRSVSHSRMNGYLIGIALWWLDGLIQNHKRRGAAQRRILPA
ncbi:hypothetical protein HAX54_014730, partial [Datura stramonium]|nr:hypothetical protein [Datura stramonium]